MPYTKRYTLAPLPNTARGECIKLDGNETSFLYANGRSIFIRNLENPTIASEYKEHKHQTTVARFSPSGYYIASGDIHGNVRIWDTVNAEHILKSEIRPIAGRVNDIAWDSESKRVIAVGMGKERFGHAFLFDSLSSVGEILGHSKQINSVSIRSKRPFRAVTASDDISLAFFTGVPFKYNKQIKDNARLIHCVQFSPNGDQFASASADGKIFLYDGTTGDKLSELHEGHHTGSVFSVSWSPDGTQILSSSGDRTAKLWDVASQKAIRTFEFGPSVEKDQQVGNLWKGDWLLSTSLSGEINYLDKNSGKISRTIDGHAKAITAMSVTSDDTLFTGAYDGRVYAWPFGEEGEKTSARYVSGEGHGQDNVVTSLSTQGDHVYSTGFDNMVRVSSVKDCKFIDQTASTSSQPCSSAVSQDKSIVVAMNSGVELYDGDLKKLGEENKLGYEPSVVSIDSSGENVYIGSKEDEKVRVYTHTKGTLSFSKELGGHSGISDKRATALAAHPRKGLLAVGDNKGKIFVYNVETGEVVINKWTYHAGSIKSLSWSNCGGFLVSGGVDASVYVWSESSPTKKTEIRNAHVDSVNGVRFLKSAEDGKLTVASAGQDATIRIWEITMP